MLPCCEVLGTLMLPCCARDVSLSFRHTHIQTHTHSDTHAHSGTHTCLQARRLRPCKHRPSSVPVLCIGLTQLHYRARIRGAENVENVYLRARDNLFKGLPYRVILIIQSRILRRKGLHSTLLYPRAA